MKVNFPELIYPKSKISFIRDYNSLPLLIEGSKYVKIPKSGFYLPILIIYSYIEIEH